MKLNLIALVVCAPLAAAQWTFDPNANTAVCDEPGDQAVPKIAACGDGRTWLGWFDNRNGAYEVYVQLLDIDGNAQLGADGLLVSANPQSSSLVDWDLIADSSGNCVLTFTDTRAGGDLDVYAYRISPAGTFMWGANGVTLSNNADYEPSPRVAELSDGSFAFVWPHLPSAGTGSLRVQRLDVNGAPLLGGGSDIALATDTTAGEKPAFCDVVAGDNGSFIVLWVRNIATFSSLRHLRTQKYDGAGAALWNGGNAVIVYDALSVPIAYYPIIESDEAGGAWYCWHRASGSTYDTFVQRVPASGVEAFAHNGIGVSSEANVWKMEPSLARHASGDVTVIFHRRNSAQSQWGVGAQRLSPAGTRLYGPDGWDLAPIDTTRESFQTAVAYGEHAVALWFSNPPASQNANVLAERLHPLFGPNVWNNSPRTVSSHASSKDDPVAVGDASGYVRAAWDDERSAGGDIYAQNFNGGGWLGIENVCGDFNFCTGAPNSVGPGAVMTTSGSNSVELNNLVLHASGCPALVNGIFFYAPAQQPAAPFGNGFRCVSSPSFRLPMVGTDAGGNASYALDVWNPPNPNGQIDTISFWYFQYWYRDPSASAPFTNLSRGVGVRFCP